MTLVMYLIDASVISELRKRQRCNIGVQKFFQHVAEQGAELYVNAITIGELRRGVELIRHRGDQVQADNLGTWLQMVLDDYADHVLDFTALESQVGKVARTPLSKCFRQTDCCYSSDLWINPRDSECS
ncbi:MAG: VapC toxin family PIN domain ribonuclease [Cyanobacteria bacterium P01_A01_bin.17]